MPGQLRLIPDEPELPDGFHYFPDFLSEAEEKALLARIEPLDWKEIRMMGVIARRRVVHYGVDYAYDDRKVTPTDPAPAFLDPFLERASRLLKIRASEIAEVLVTKYPPGAGIGWHRDAPPFGDQVFGFSLASSCTMKFRRKRGQKYQTLKMELSPRSGYILSGPARREWQHSIPAVETLRYSITLRTLR